MNVAAGVLSAAGLSAVAWGVWPAQAPDAALHEPLADVVRELDAAEVLGAEWVEMPLDLEVWGDRLAVVEAYGEPALRVLDRRSGSLELGHGQFGEGPGEFSGPAMGFPLDPSSESVWLFDRELLRLTRVSTKSGLAPSERTERLIQLKGEFRPMAAAPLADGGWAGVGWFHDRSRLGFFDADGNLTRTAGRLDAPEDLPVQSLHYIYRAHMRTSPDGRRVALATRFASQVEIFDQEGELVARAEAPVPVEPRFTFVQKGDKLVTRRLAETRYAYIDVATTDDRIYALFSGRSVGEWAEAASRARHVHVFDWSGNLIEVIRLDRDVFGVAIGPLEQDLYAIVHEPQPAIVRFPIAGSLAMNHKPDSRSSTG